MRSYLVLPAACMARTGERCPYQITGSAVCRLHGAAAVERDRQSVPPVSNAITAETTEITCLGWGVYR